MDSPEHSARFDDWLVDHRGIVFKVARSYAAQSADEAELVQEILVQLWRSVSGFKGQCSVVTWIYRVSLNTALMWQRGQRRRHAVMEPMPTPRFEVPAPEPRPGWTAEQAELLEQLYAAIRALSPAERMISCSRSTDSATARSARCRVFPRTASASRSLGRGRNSP